MISSGCRSLCSSELSYSGMLVVVWAERATWRGATQAGARTAVPTAHRKSVLLLPPRGFFSIFIYVAHSD